MAEAVQETVSETAATETKTKSGKVAKTGNVIADTAAFVESLTKTKALNEGHKLADDIEANYLMLGGILKVIKENSWFEGQQDFPTFVRETYGFELRKAMYLISIYDNLVTKQIPWEKVSQLGWTKLKDLAGVLTVENVDEWVLKATPVTVAELQAMLKAAKEGSGEKTVKTTDEIVKMNFKFKPDQADIVQQAIAKAKGELGTEYDAVALEGICSGFVGGNTAAPSLKSIVTSLGFEQALSQIADMYPEYDINVGPAKKAGEPAAPTP